MTYKDKPSTPSAKGNEVVAEELSATPEETTSLLVGYGSVDHKDGVETPFDASEDFPLDGNDNVSSLKRKSRWAWVGAGALLYVAGVVAWNNNRSSQVALGTQEAVPDVELLGKKGKTSKKPKFEPVTYPDCPSGVDITYIKEALPFEMHEAAAEASNCTYDYFFVHVHFVGRL
jgi:hypothetical protein